MSQFSERVLEAFKLKQARVVEAPKWGMTFSVFPLTVAQLEAIDSEPNDYTRAIRTIIVRAKHADCSPVFDETDFENMRTYGVDAFGPSEIFEVAKAINSDAPEAEPDEIIEDMEEN